MSLIETEVPKVIYPIVEIIEDCYGFEKGDKCYLLSEKASFRDYYPLVKIGDSSVFDTCKSDFKRISK